jgi:hypothetical protein
MPAEGTVSDFFNYCATHIGEHKSYSVNVYNDGVVLLITLFWTLSIRQLIIIIKLLHFEGWIFRWETPVLLNATDRELFIQQYSYFLRI